MSAGLRELLDFAGPGAGMTDEQHLAFIGEILRCFGGTGVKLALARPAGICVIEFPESDSKLKFKRNSVPPAGVVAAKGSSSPDPRRGASTGGADLNSNTRQESQTC